MRRRLLPTLAVVSLACCVLLFGLWVRSYWWCESFGIGAGQYWLDVYAVSGLVVLDCSRNDDDPEPLGVRLRGGSEARTGWDAILDTTNVSQDECWGTAWFGYGGVTYTTGTPYARTVDHRSIWLPLCIPILLTLVPPALWLWHRRKQRVGTGFPVYHETRPETP